MSVKVGFGWLEIWFEHWNEQHRFILQIRIDSSFRKFYVDVVNSKTIYQNVNGFKKFKI